MAQKDHVTVVSPSPLFTTAQVAQKQLQWNKNHQVQFTTAQVAQKYQGGNGEKRPMFTTAQVAQKIIIQY